MDTTVWLGRRCVWHSYTSPSGGGAGGKEKINAGMPLAPAPIYLHNLPTPMTTFLFYIVTMAYDHDDDDRKLPAASVGEEDDSDVEMEGE